MRFSLVCTMVFVSAGIGPATPETSYANPAIPTSEYPIVIEVEELSPAGIPCRTRAVYPGETLGSLNIGDFHDGFDSCEISSGSPPDPICAVSQDYIVTMANYSIEWEPKVGGTPVTQVLSEFFSVVGNVIDPYIVYDRIHSRFVVTAFWKDLTGSRLGLAVSNSGNPNDGWETYSLSGSVVINGFNTSIDRPTVAIGDEALYVSAFQSGAGASGYRLYIIDKDEAYSGVTPSFMVVDPLEAVPAGFERLQYIPVERRVGVGTGPDMYLVGYSGATDGESEYLSIISVDDPLGTPSFGFTLVDVGDIDNLDVTGSNPYVPAEDYGTPVAPQPTGPRLTTSDRRVLDAIWIGNQLWMVAHVVPPSGPDQNQVTAHWWRVDVSNPLSVDIVEQGDIGGEDIGTGVWTYYPSVAVDLFGNLVVGYVASSTATVYPGAYFAVKPDGEPTGSSNPLAVGEGEYSQNRWGDYSGTALDPDNRTFWVFNAYALGDGPQGNSRWATRWGSIRVHSDIPVPGDFLQIADAIFVADDGDRILVSETPNPYLPITVTKWIDVLGIGEDMPTIDGGTTNDNAVVINHPFARVSGFDIRGGTQAVVKLSNGQIDNCAISATTSDLIGIELFGGSHTVSNCSIDIPDSAGIVQVGGFGRIDSTSVKLSFGTGVRLAGDTLSSSTVLLTSSGLSNVGVQADPGLEVTNLITNCLIASPGGIGINLSQASAVRYCTIVNSKWGVIDLVNGAVTNCIAATDDLGFISGGSNKPTYSISQSGFQHKHSTSVEEDPLFCDLGGEHKYTLRVDSYGNPRNNPSGNPIGAFPVACMYGSTVRAATFSGNDSLLTVGDVVLNYALALDPGTIVAISEDDTKYQYALGTSGKIDIVGLADISILGAAGNPSILQSSAAVPAEGDWVGIYVDDGVACTIDHVEIRHSETAVYTGVEPSTVTIKNSLIDSNQVSDVDITSQNGINLQNNVFSVGSGSGVNVALTNKLAALVADGNNFNGTAASSFGLRISGLAEVPGGSGNYLNYQKVNSNVFSNFTGGKGLDLDIYGSVLVTGNTFQSNQDGLVIEGADSLQTAKAFIGESGSPNNVFQNNTRGIRIGRYAANTKFRKNDISYNITGVYAYQGVGDFGTGDTTLTYGFNRIIGDSLFCIDNKTSSTLLAHGNFFGGCGGVPACFNGNVDLSNYLCADPLSYFMEKVIVQEPAKIYVSPNPALASARIFLRQLPNSSGSIDIYDIQGREIRHLFEVNPDQGDLEVKWDLKGDNGVKVASGIYFVRSAFENGESRVTKVLVVSGGRDEE